MLPAAFKSQPSRHHLPPRRYQTTVTASVILRPLHCPHRPITATNEDGTSCSNGKQVTAGRHVTTESQSDTAAPSSPPDTALSPPARYTITSTASSQKMPQAALQRRRPDVARPPASNDDHRTGQHVTFQGPYHKVQRFILARGCFGQSS